MFKINTTYLSIKIDIKKTISWDTFLEHIMKKTIISFIILFSLINFFCSTGVYYVKPPDWSNLNKRDSTIKFYSQYLKDRKFFLDPGHGGNDRRNHGPREDVIEADINLKLSLTLKDYLEKAGAKVFMSRIKDTSIELLERAGLANKSGADMFISVHHNALGNDDHYTNYTSTWYHALEGDDAYHPSNHDIAKYVQRDLAYVMGNNGPLSSFDGTMSDYTVYPNSGFAVLRNTEIPGILIEGSFFSSYYEEQRLKLPEFNEIEAWGVFRGLAKYLRAGIPNLEFIGNSVFEEYKPLIKIKVSDKRGINSKTIEVKLDKKEIDFNYNAKENIISFTPREDLANGEHLLDVTVENKNGNHSFPFIKKITISSPPVSIKTEVIPKTIPPMRNAQSNLFISVYDKNNNPVADGTEIKISITSGSCPYSIRTKNGRAHVYLNASGQKGFGLVMLNIGDLRAEDTLFYFFKKEKYISGVIKDNQNNPIEGAGVILPREEASIFSSPNYILSLEGGKFMFSTELSDTINLNVLKDGYFGKSIGYHLESDINLWDISLSKVNNGVLYDKVFVIDPRYGGNEKGENYNGKNAADVNLEIANYLYSMLKAAGAKAYLTRDKDAAIPDEERAKVTQKFKTGNYIRIDVSKGENVNIIQYPNIPNSRFSHNLFKGINKITKLDTGVINTSREDIFSWSGIGTVSISLPGLNSNYFKSDNIKFLESQIAWGIYTGILLNNGSSEGKSIKARIEPTDNKEKGGIEAVLDNCLISVTNKKGEIEFYNITGGDGQITILSDGKFEIK
jgi:N-acetylmuramoyl-L-alanine amidase